MSDERSREDADPAGLAASLAALHHDEKLLARIFNRSSNCMALTDAVTYRIVDVNRSWLEVTGIARQEALGRTAPELGLLARGATREGYIEELVTTGRIIEREVALTLRGALRQYLLSAEILDVQGMRLALWEFRDITELKRTAEAALESEARLRSLSDHLPGGMVFQLDTGVDGGQRHFTYLSAGVEQLHGVDAVALMRDAQLFYGQLVEEDRQLVSARESDAQAAMTPFSCEVRFKMPSQVIRWSLLTSAPRRAPNGHIVWDGIEIDVTERRQLENRLRHSEKMEAIGQLAGGVAHDFNNQLGGILGYADLLSRRIDDPGLRGYADGIIKAARRAAELTQKLLAFARKGNYISVPVNLHEVIHEVVNLLKHSLDKRIVIKQRLAAQAPVTRGDPTQLLNALLNLALNARDAMPQGGELTLTSAVARLEARAFQSDIAGGDYAQISVDDTGVGMSDETRRHLFEPFFTTKDVGKGTGLGLAAVYGTIKSHGGAIAVESVLGRGTSFKLYVPLSAARSEAASAATKAVPVHPAARILVVDDEAVCRDMARELLQLLGHQVHCCVDGVDAVDFYQQHWSEIDLVILDMIMARSGGRDTYRAMRAINPGVRALLSSGYSLDGEAQSILDDGVLGFVQKPFDTKELSQRLADALKRR